MDSIQCNCMRIASDDPRYSELELFIEQQHGKMGMSMSVLQEAQRIFGFLPLEIHKYIAEKTGENVAELYGVTTFYSQFTTEPKGKHEIKVCLGTACYVKGAQKVLDKVSKSLNIQVGKTTDDGLFTLEATRCLGCCGLAPVMMIDDDVYANLVKLDEIEVIIDRYRKQEVHGNEAI